MTKQLINEAKRFQELAGIKQLNEIKVQRVVWVFGAPGNPNEEVNVYDGFGEDRKLVETITKGELWDQDSGFRGVLPDNFAKTNEDGTWDMAINDGEFEYSPLKIGKDFELVSESRLRPLLEAYDNDMFQRLAPDAYFEANLIYYLEANDWELETGTDEWMDLGEIVGEENMPEYIDFIENTLKINIF